MCSVATGAPLVPPTAVTVSTALAFLVAWLVSPNNRAKHHERLSTPQGPVPAVQGLLLSLAVPWYALPKEHDIAVAQMDDSMNGGEPKPAVALLPRAGDHCASTRRSLRTTTWNKDLERIVTVPCQWRQSTNATRCMGCRCAVAPEHLHGTTHANCL